MDVKGGRHLYAEVEEIKEKINRDLKRKAVLGFMGALTPASPAHLQTVNLDQP